MSIDQKVERVKEAIKNGAKLKHALTDANLSPGTWYTRAARSKKLAPVIKKRRKRGALKVLDVPTTPQFVNSKLFLICGDAQSLAEFARSYQ